MNSLLIQRARSNDCFSQRMILFIPGLCLMSLNLWNIPEWSLIYICDRKKKGGKMKKYEHALIIGLLLGVVCFTYGQDITIGGDLKFYMGDISTGSSWITDTLGTAEYDTTDRFSMGFGHLTLYFLSQIGDYVSLDLEPEILAHSSATPKLGKRIGEQRPASAEGVEIEISKALITVVAPAGFEISAGLLRPVFTEDYGLEKFYQENYHAHKAVCNPWLGSWHDTGLEIYRSFDIQVSENSYASIPCYLYVMNGGYEIADNNTDKTVMLHIAPEFANFRILGSAAYGKWDAAGDNTVIRYAGGLAVDFNIFWLRGEYMAGTWDNKYTFAGDTFDLEPQGFYVKAGVNIIPDKLSLMAYYDYAKHNWSGFFFVGGTEEETYTTITGVLNYQVATGSHIMLQVDKADWKNESETQKLDYIRATLGWRTIF